MVIRPSLLFCSTLLGVGVPSFAQNFSAQDFVVHNIKGSAVKSASEEAAWWAGLSTEYKEKLSERFFPSWFNTLEETEKISYCYVASQFYDFLESGVDSNPDDSYVGFAPLLLRTSFHSSGSYHHGSGAGGSNGGTIFNPAELADDFNGCIQTATDAINNRLNSSATVSLADAVVIAGNVALDVMKFPRMDIVQVQGGRVDLEFSARVNTLSSPDNDPMTHFQTKYNLTTSELVAVIGGGHNFGAAHGMCSGYNGQWTSSPLTWANPTTGVPEFFVDLMRDDWIWRKICTYENGTTSYLTIPDPFSANVPEEEEEEETTPSSSCKISQSLDPRICESQAMRGCDFDDGLYNTSVSPCDANLLQMRLRSDFFLIANEQLRIYAEAFAKDHDLAAQEFGIAYRKLMHNGLDRCGLAGSACDDSSNCITRTDTETGRYLSSTCVIKESYFNDAAAYEDDYGLLSHGASVAVIVLLVLFFIISIVLAFKLHNKSNDAQELTAVTKEEKTEIYVATAGSMEGRADCGENDS